MGRRDRSGFSCGRTSWGSNSLPHTPHPGSLLSEAPTGPRGTPRGTGAEGGKHRVSPQDPSRCAGVPRVPPWSPTTRSPTCTLPLDQFCCIVFYEHADGMARARGKVLPWDKKLTLANSKFTACIFIFLIPAPSASNWGSTSPFSPLISPARSYLFFSFYAAGPSRCPPAGAGDSILPPECPGGDQQATRPAPGAEGNPVSASPCCLRDGGAPHPHSMPGGGAMPPPMRKTDINQPAL